MELYIKAYRWEKIIEAKTIREIQRNYITAKHPHRTVRKKIYCSKCFLCTLPATRLGKLFRFKFNKKET